jgi:hypothetical protein
MSASHALSIIILLVSPMSASWPCVPERFNLICGWSEVTEIVLHYSSLDPQQLINAETHKLPNIEPIANIDAQHRCTALPNEGYAQHIHLKHYTTLHLPFTLTFEP